MKPLSIEDLAQNVVNGPPHKCLCDDFAKMILQQHEEIKRLKAIIDSLETELFEGDEYIRGAE